MKNIPICFCMMLLSASLQAEVQSDSATSTRRHLSRAANRSIVSGTTTTNGVTWSYSVVDGAVVLGRLGSQRSSAVPRDTAGALVIPNVLDGKPVRDIRFGAFHTCTNVTSVVIPSSVMNIDEGAFVFCNSLKEFVVADGNAAYSSMDGVLFDAEVKKLISCPAAKSGEYVIPSSVTNVGWGAFNSCAKLTSVTIPNGVESVGGEAFKGCCLLQSVTIPSSVKVVHRKAFQDCPNLKTVNVIRGGNVEPMALDVFLKQFAR